MPLFAFDNFQLHICWSFCLFRYGDVREGQPVAHDWTAESCLNLVSSGFVRKKNRCENLTTVKALKMYKSPWAFMHQNAYYWAISGNKGHLCKYPAEGQMLVWVLFLVTNDRLVPMAEFSLVSWWCPLVSYKARRPFQRVLISWQKPKDEQPGASSGIQGYRGTNYFLLDHP